MFLVLGDRTQAPGLGWKGRVIYNFASLKVHERGRVDRNFRNFQKR